MLTPYTEQDLKDVLVLEAADTPVVPELWQQLQRRRARRRLQLTSGAAVVAVVLTGTLVTTLGRSTDANLSTGKSAAWTVNPVRPLTTAELQQSAQIISQRLTLLHISAKVRVVGDHLAVTHAAALSRHTLAQVVQVGDAQVRRILQVQDEVPPDHTFAPRATTFATLATAMRAWPHQDCRPGLPSATPAHDYVGACDPADSQHFLLGSRSLVRRDFARAVAFTDNNVGLDGVLLTVTHAATAKARAITTSALLRPSPPNCAPPTGCDEVALTLDGVVLAQPRVIAPAPGRMLQFGVQRGSPPAHVLAAILNTPVLPSSFTLA